MRQTVRPSLTVRLLVGGPQYDVADGIRHSLQWAAIRDDILPPAG
jgi:hypothetical protein